MKSCELPFIIDVEMKAYHNRAFPLGVIKASIQDYDVWLCNKLINSIYSNSIFKNAMNSYDEDLWSSKDGLTSIRRVDLSQEDLHNTKFDIVHMHKEMLEEGSYIHGTYDEFFIKGKSPYNKYHFMHDYIIWGFDDEEGVFKSAAYLSDGSYSLFDIEYGDYYNSIAKSQFDLFVTYVQVNRRYSPQINIGYIKKKLENHLFSKEDSMPEHEGLWYGMEAWDKFREYVKNIGENELDFRYGRICMEHRYIMTKRIQKLLELKLLKDSILENEYYNNVYIYARATHFLFMKYNLTKDPSVLHRIIATMKKANENEAKIICRILQEL